jgi:hypothetical protein
MRWTHGFNDKFSIVEGSTGTQDDLADSADAPGTRAFGESFGNAVRLSRRCVTFNMQQRKWSPEWASMI